MGVNRDFFHRMITRKLYAVTMICFTVPLIMLIYRAIRINSSKYGLLPLSNRKQSYAHQKVKTVQEGCQQNAFTMHHKKIN
nr:unnamed protein product [Spirometra erinaceieuropaei]